MFRKLLILLTVFISSCTGREEMRRESTFFDIKGFFELEAKRLTINRTLVNKSVKQNDELEIKKGISVDWENELALFIDSDINKSAWKDSYKVKEDSFEVSYLAIDTNLRTRFLSIKKDKQGRAVYFRIKNMTHSKLYESSEELTYIPDSVYSINKNQSVRFLGNNNYQISGKVMK